MLGCVNPTHGMWVEWKLSWSDLDSGALLSGTMWSHLSCTHIIYARTTMAIVRNGAISPKCSSTALRLLDY